MSVRVGINGFGRIGRNVFRAAQAAGVRPLFVTTGQAAGRPPPPGIAAVPGLEAAARAVLEGTRHAGMQKARPAPAVTERAWPGMPAGRGRPRP